MCNCNKITICTEFDPVQIAGLQVPIASIHAFATQTVPDGYLICDGSEVSRADYADLYAALGTVWGEGDGTTTFNIPDLRGEFLRGFDADRGVDEGREFGSMQEHSLQKHTHRQWHLERTFTSTGGNSSSRRNSTLSEDEFETFEDGEIGNFANETRPRNVAVTYAIKATNPASA